MSDIAIRFENVSKLYRLGTVGTGTIAHDIQRWWTTSVLHKEDPYLKIGETNDRSSKGHSNYVFALKDITFDVKQGEVLGIIGKNGAGKSTLLKLLSRVTYPTTGNIYVKGRIASLLEVGTGFHPELTGRENIYMNGSILGMKKHEIDRKLDEIVEFSGCERYLDTPVKRYSSGMMVRLGFAVAAHLEPEILVVDEVLAVGDAEFQKKAIGKMQDVSKGEGRTVLFVSHNMASLRQLCSKGILLNNGSIQETGDIDPVVDNYLSDANLQAQTSFNAAIDGVIKNDGIELLELSILNTIKQKPKIMSITDKIGFYIKYRINNTLYRPDLSFLITTSSGDKVFHSVFKTDDYKVGVKEYIAWIPPDLLNSIDYLFTLGITTSNPTKIHIQKTIKFSVEDDYNSKTRNNNYKGLFHGVVRPIIEWEKTY